MLLLGLVLVLVLPVLAMILIQSIVDTWPE